MEGALRRTITVGLNGWVEGMETDLAPGTTAELLIVPKTYPGKPLSPEERAATIERMRELSDRAIAAGMETWDVDRINAEIAERRGDD